MTARSLLLRSVLLLASVALVAACAKGDAPAPTAAAPAPAAAPAAPAAASAAPAASAPAVTAEGWRVTPPAGWVAEPTSAGGMRLAQYRLARAEGDARDGEVTIIVAGGDVAANVARWQGQFEGSPPIESRPAEAAGAALQRVTIAGTFLYKERPMAPGPAERIEGAVVEAVILPGAGGQSVFIKGWGPRATMERWAGSWDTLIGSLERAAP